MCRMTMSSGEPALSKATALPGTALAAPPRTPTARNRNAGHFCSQVTWGGHRGRGRQDGSGTQTTGKEQRDKGACLAQGP